MLKKLPKIKIISEWLKDARSKLLDSSTNSPILDSELILAHVLKTTRQTLHTYPEKELSVIAKRKATKLLKLRLKGFPVPYITGIQDFFGYDFIVNKDVLIPRPESETMIDLALNHLPIQKTINILDVGCGSGSLGQALALELIKLGKNYNLTQSDISKKALKVAMKNAVKHSLNAHFVRSDLLTKTGSSFDIILANLPYVNHNWSFINGVEYEPKIAIFAPDNGLALIKKFIQQITYNNTQKNRLFLIESDISQIDNIHSLLKKVGAKEITSKEYITSFRL